MGEFCRRIYDKCCMSEKNFTLKSPDWQGQVPPRCAYRGCVSGAENLSPALEWIDPPDGAAGFALTLYDPDAPTGSGWWHWLAFNIPRTATSLSAGAGSPGSHAMWEGAVQSVNDYGEFGYGGPCPPKGDRPHRYILTVYALPTAKMEGLDRRSSPVSVAFALNSESLARASLIAYFGVGGGAGERS